MRGRKSVYKAVLIQVMAWAKRCIEVIQLKKAWEQGRAPEAEMAERAIPREDDQKLEEEVFNPKTASSAAAFKPKPVEIKVYGSVNGKGAKAKEAAEAAKRVEAPAPVVETPIEVSPLAEVPQAALEAVIEEPPIRTPFTPVSDPRKSTLLVIDDYEPLLHMLTKAMQGAGYNVCSAKDGVEGLVRLHENQVDLIITDVQMPKIDGFDFSRMLNVREATRDIPIIFLTEVLDDQTKAVAKRLGAADTLIKPFTLDSLFESVKMVLAPQRMLRGMPASTHADQSKPLFAVVK
jgi:CheY-like chemotaxis protein